MSLFNLYPASKFGYSAGGNGSGSSSKTVPTGWILIGGTCLSVSGGSFTVAPGGANQPSSPIAGDTITLVAGSSFDLSIFGSTGQLGGGTVFAFTNCDSWVLTYAKMGAG